MKIEIKDVHGILYPIEISQLFGPTVAAVYAVLLAASENNIAELSCNEIARQVGIKSRKTVGGIIKKLESLELVERYYHDGYAPRYYVKNVMMNEINLVEQPKLKLPEQVPARRSERVQPYYKPKKELVWRSDDGNLVAGYKYYGKLNMVAITDAEYSALCDKHTKKVVDDYIYRIETHCKAYGKQNEYQDFASVIEEWIRKDKERDKKDLKRKNKGIYMDDVITRQEMEELDKYRELENVFDEDVFNRKEYGKHGLIWLSEREYKKLCDKHGKEMVDTVIEEQDEWCKRANTCMHNEAMIIIDNVISNKLLEVEDGKS